MQGKTTGVPVISVPNVAAEAAAQAAAGSSQNSLAQSIRPQQNLTPAIITVEVVGYGGADQ